MTPTESGPETRAAGETAGSRALGAMIDRALAGGAAGPSVPTGFPSLDHLLGGGFRRGDLAILAGDVGSGKSALALAIALRAAAARQGVAFLSGEMAIPRVVERALAMEGRVRVDDLRRRGLEESPHAVVSAAARALRERAPVLDYLGDAGVAGVSDLLVEHLGLDLVVVDSLQSLAMGRGPLEEEIGAAARALKELAIRRSTAIIATAHLAQPPRGRSDPRPRMEDLGGLGAVRQQADIVLGLFREEAYDPHPHIHGAAELHVLKNRNGPAGLVDLYFYAEWLRFEDVMEPGSDR
jgi:replicative DNA helicase